MLSGYVDYDEQDNLVLVEDGRLSQAPDHESSRNSNSSSPSVFGGISSLYAHFSSRWNKSNQQEEVPPVCVKQEREKAMQSGQVARLRLVRRREFVEDDDGDRHFRLVESQFQRNQQNSNATIREVEYVINPSLIRRFEAKKQSLMSRHGFDDERKLNIVLAWHGTPRANIDGMVHNNFDLKRLSENSGDHGWYGAGVYFSELESVSRDFGDALLLCKVILGKVHEMRRRENGRALKPGYDSHVVLRDGGRLSGARIQCGREIVIFDVDQILPCYIVKC